VNRIVLLVISLFYPPSENIKLQKFYLSSTKKLNRMLIVIFHLPWHTDTYIKSLQTIIQIIRKVEQHFRNIDLCVTSSDDKVRSG